MCVSHAHDRLSLHAVSRLFGAFPAFDQGSVIGANDPSLRSVADRRMRLVQRLGRAGLAACAELVVWVQSDRDEARRQKRCEPERSWRAVRSAPDRSALGNESLAVTRRACGFSSAPAVTTGVGCPLSHRLAHMLCPLPRPKTDAQGPVNVIALPSLFGDRRAANAAPRLLRPPRCSRRRAGPGSLRRGLWSGQCVWWPKRSPR
jgi:hypothetical protein